MKGTAPLNIGKRLRELRQAKGFSQGDIQKRTGLMRSYVARVENGHTVPTLNTLRKWTKALGLPLGQFFADIKTLRERAKPVPVTPYEKRLFGVLSRVRERDRRLFLSLANSMARQGGRSGRKK